MVGVFLVAVTGLQLALVSQGARSGAVDTHFRGHQTDEESARFALWLGHLAQGQGKERKRREAPPEVDSAGSEEEEEQEQAPESGLRRWVIRIRNVMYGRRDLEATEDGEEESQPPQGHNWIESLAHWFAHGIKKILIRMSGPELPDQSGEMPEPEVSTDGDRNSPRPSPTAEAHLPQPPGTLAALKPKLRPTPVSDQTSTFVPAIDNTSSHLSTVDPVSTPQSRPLSSPATIFDDEAYEDMHPMGNGASHVLEAPRPQSHANPPPDETNELS